MSDDMLREFIAVLPQDGDRVEVPLELLRSALLELQRRRAAERSQRSQR